VAPSLSHKTEAGGVRVDLRDAAEVEKAHREMSGSLRSFGPDARLLAQKMLRGGREVIFGVSQDPKFGPLAMFGLGGVFVEVLKDVAFKNMPLTDREAEEMIRAIKGYPLLSGFRGEKGVDQAVLQEMLLRLSQLVAEHPEIDALDVNPFIAAPTREGSAAVDARMRIRIA
jgi:acetyltransferase